MAKSSPYVLTISRQFGSGGSYLGSRLAAQLNILYLDREILQRAAQELGIPEIALQQRDEKVTPLWKSLLQSTVYATSWIYTPPSLDWATDETLYNTESAIIIRIAEQSSAVIVGRAGYYVLRSHPRCLSIFLHAHIDFRQQRIQELYHVTAPEALKLISSIDQERERYLRKLTGQSCLDACQYHLSLDTSVVGLDKAEDIIHTAINARFGNIETNC